MQSITFWTFKLTIEIENTKSRNILKQEIFSCQRLSTSFDRHSTFINNLIRFRMCKMCFEFFGGKVCVSRNGNAIYIYKSMMARFELIHLNGLFDMERKRQSWNRDVCTKPFQIHGRNNLAQSPHAGKNVYDNQKRFHCDIQLNCWIKSHFPL